MGIGSNQSPVQLSGTLTLPAAAGASDSFAVGPRSVVGISTPATLVSTALTLEVSDDNATWLAARDATGNVLTITVGTSRYISLPPVPYGLLPKYMRLVTAATETAVRSIGIWTRPLL
jgi:hypothetical protein